MKFSFAAAVLAGSALVAAVPLEGSHLFNRGAVESTDGTCGTAAAGAGKGFVCPKGTNKCCSKYGWCGDSELHCGTGCQGEFSNGSCKQGPSFPDHKPKKKGKHCKPPGHGPKPSGHDPKPSPSAGIPSPGTPSSSTGKPASSGASSPTHTGGATATPSSSGPKPTSSGSHVTSSVPESHTPSATAGESVSSVSTLVPSSTTTTTPGQPAPTLPAGEWIYSCNVENTVALTFDDGPFTYTEELLDMLDAAGAKGTFFINGANFGPDIANDPKMQQLLQRMVSTGHQVGSHTYNHEDLGLATTDIKGTMEKLDNGLRTWIGKAPTYMRPPFFSCGDSCLDYMKTNGYKVLNADLDTKDYENTKSIQVSIDTFNSLIDTKRMVLMHEVHETTVKQLMPEILKVIKEKNLKAVTAGECLGQSPDTWYRA